MSKLSGNRATHIICDDIYSNIQTYTIEDTQITTMLDFHEKDLALERLLNCDTEPRDKYDFSTWSTIRAGILPYRSWCTPNLQTQYSQLQMVFTFKLTPSERIKHFTEFVINKSHKRKKGKYRKF